MLGAKYCRRTLLTFNPLVIEFWIRSLHSCTRVQYIAWTTDTYHWLCLSHQTLKRSAKPGDYLNRLCRALVFPGIPLPIPSNTMAPTPEDLEAKAFYFFGIIILADFASAITLTLLYGVFVLLFSMSSAMILRQGLGPRSRQAMFLLTLISFATATVHWAVAIAAFVKEVQSVLSRNLDTPFFERLLLSANSPPSAPVFISMWAAAFLSIISDIVVIWRAWVLFFENRWVMIGPLALLLGTITTTLLYLIPLFNPEVFEATVSGENPYSVINNLRTVSLALSLATNALATLMIAYKLWQHRTFLTEMLGSNRPRSRAQNVLIMLVESGVLYFILHLVTFLLSTCPGPWAEFVSSKVVFSIYYEFTAMYPTIVVVLVNHQRSFADTCGFSNLDLNDAQTHEPNILARPVTFGHLSFARPPAKASGDDSPEIQNLIEESITDIEGGASETRLLKGTVMMDVDVEKRQAKTAPF
ncbi:hypothetical protein Hypma_007109 [Hypsizygus marmoreus]|uniref:Uncharacterized protein n=1 Tax=Hypsizygus marmoreus TaxID=39966 RepID=A0A369KCR7_HYPMA|nr:hypothetical protein Hypma_007109 [Hypsizygus marmoreus]